MKIGNFNLSQVTEVKKRKSFDRRADTLEIYERREKARAKSEGREYKSQGVKYMERMMSYYGKDKKV